MGRLGSPRVYLKDLEHFMGVDFKLNKTIVVDSKPHLCAMDLNNLVPVVPYCHPDPSDDQLPKLADYLKQLTSFHDVKECNKSHFALSRCIKHVSLEDIIKHTFK